MIRTLVVPILLTIATALPPPLPAAETPTRIRIVSGVTAKGDATPLWLAMVRKRGADDRLASAIKPLTPEERAWAQYIRTRSAQWPAQIPALAQPFAPAGAPRSISIVLGNRAAADAFTHDEVTIGFDLSELQRNYGPPTAPANADLMDRLFRHEFTHLLQKRWLALHPWPTDSPMRTALYGLWSEGLGNYYSLSARWKPTAEGPSPATTAALAELEPLFTESMAALACTDSATAAPLLAHLSSGPFNKKWGALPVALWLQREVARDPEAIRNFAIGGPAGVWDFAARNLPAELAGKVAEAREATARCN